MDNDLFQLHSTYLDRFSKTHFSSIVSGHWNPDTYAPLRERASARAETARAWYETVTGSPTKLGKRIARIMTKNGLDAVHEKTVTSPNGSVRADVFVSRSISPPNVIVELKAFSPQNTMPSTISDAIKTTLRRHAQFAGFLQKA
jgi:hypothetical protein